MKPSRHPPSKLRIGDVVRVVKVPDPVRKHGPSETRSVFRRAVGNTFVVQGFGRYGHIELDVSKIKKLNTIWIESECLELFRRRPKRRSGKRRLSGRN